MPRSIHKLNVRSIAAAKTRGLFADGGGLYLQVARNGSRSWLFRYRRDGRTRHMGLGALHTVSLVDAREAARACRALLINGIDPLDDRKQKTITLRLEAARSMTFDQCAAAYIAAYAASWKSEKHAAQWSATLATYVSKLIGSLPVHKIDVGHVMSVLEPIWTEKPETASRVRGRIEAVLDWATVRTYRVGENPARWRGHLEKLLPSKSKIRPAEHHAALPFAEIGQFME